MKIFNCLIVSFFIAYFFSCTYSFSQSQTSLRRIYLSGTDSNSGVYWDFKISKGRKKDFWTKIPVPSNWELHGFGNFTSNLEPTDSLSGEVGEYKLEFQVDKAYKRKQIFLVFEGLQSEAMVRINGKPLFSIPSDHSTRFKADISSLLNFGQRNLLEVSVSKQMNSLSNPDFTQGSHWIMGGIDGPVYLEVLPELFFPRVMLDAQAAGQLDALVLLNQSVSHAAISLELLDPSSGQVLEKISQPVDSDRIRISHVFTGVVNWSPEQAKRYELRILLTQKGKTRYEHREKIGFRSLEMHSQDGLILNGERVILRGVNLRPFHPMKGTSLTAQHLVEDLLLIKSMNANALRILGDHLPERLLELSDSLGIFVLKQRAALTQLTLSGQHPSLLLLGGDEEKRGSEELDFLPVSIPSIMEITVAASDSSIFLTNKLNADTQPFLLNYSLNNAEGADAALGVQALWDTARTQSNFLGLFIGSFALEGLLRDDLGGIISFPTATEKEAIVNVYRQPNPIYEELKSLWFPVYMHEFIPTENFRGKIKLENRFQFTDLSCCTLDYFLSTIQGWKSPEPVDSRGFSLPATLPGDSVELQLPLPLTWREADILQVNVLDAQGSLLSTQSRAIHQAAQGNARNFPRQADPIFPISLRESSTQYQVAVGDKIYFFTKSTGFLEKVMVDRKIINFHQNPAGRNVLEGQHKKPDWKKLKDGSIQINSYKGNTKLISWTVMPNSELKFEGSVALSELDSAFGILHVTLPAEKLLSIKWIGNAASEYAEAEGKFGLWERNLQNQAKQFQSSSIEPSWSGHYTGLHAVKFLMEEGEIELRNMSEDLVLSLRMARAESLISAEREAVKIPLVFEVASKPSIGEYTPSNQGEVKISLLLNFH